MNKTIIFKKIGGIISEITEQYQYLAENPENINPLELELFIANSHFLAEHLAILKKIEEQPLLLHEKNPVVLLQEKQDSGRITILPEGDGAEKEETGPVPNSPVSGVEDAEIDSVNWFKLVESETNDSPDKTEVVEFIPLNGDVKTQIDLGGPAENPTGLFDETPMPSSNAGSVNKEIAGIDSLKPDGSNAIKPASDEKPQTLNEVLSAGMTRENMAFKMNQNENKDLKSMIKLNDKLMFVRDLFNGYSLAYSEAIELVNRFDNFESAENFLKQNYADKNKWAEKQSTVDQFYEILNRRFS